MPASHTQPMAVELPSPPFLTITEVAAHLKVHDRTVLRWIHEGDLPAYRVGRRQIRLTPQDVDDFVHRVRGAR